MDFHSAVFRSRHNRVEEAFEEAEPKHPVSLPSTTNPVQESNFIHGKGRRRRTAVASSETPWATKNTGAGNNKSRTRITRHTPKEQTPGHSLDRGTGPVVPLRTLPSHRLGPDSRLFGGSSH